MAQTVKNLPAVQVRSLGQEDPGNKYTIKGETDHQARLDA